MWEVLFAEIVKNVLVPELAEFIKSKYQQTGQWPTKEELDNMVDAKRDAIKEKGLEFLNRPTDPPVDKE